MPIDFHGKQYVTVDERLIDARGEGFVPPVGIHSVEIEWKDVAGMAICIATVTFLDDQGVAHRFEGSSHANAGARNPIAGQNPVETAETSAVGRALRFAGYGTEPSADEMLIAASRAPAPLTPAAVAHAPAHAPTQAPRPSPPRSFDPRSGSYPATDKQRAAVARLADENGLEVDLDALTKSEASEIIGQYSRGGGSWSR